MTNYSLLIDMVGTPDDLLAVAAAKARPEIEIACVTSVMGAALDGAAGGIVALLGVDAPYVIGAEKGILNYNHSSRHREPRWPENWLGARPLSQSSQNAVALMAQTIQRADKAVAILALGPLTNVATLLVAHPELRERIECIVVNGGSCFGGDALGSVEYNMLLDPEAAHIVFASGLTIKMTGMDIEPPLQLGESDAARFKEQNGDVTGVVAGLLADGARLSLRGVAAVAALLDLPAVALEDQYVVVDLVGRYTRGATAADRLGTSNNAFNTWVAMGVDRESVFSMALESLKP